MNFFGISHFQKNIVGVTLISTVIFGGGGKIKSSRDDVERDLVIPAKNSNLKRKNYVQGDQKKTSQSLIF